MNAGEQSKRQSRILLPVSAVILGVLLLFTWINALAAEPGASAALQGAFDFTVTKTAFPTIFSRTSSNNLYQIVIAAENYSPGEANTIYIEDRLPNGVTWDHTQDIPYWDCTATSDPQNVNCFYENVFTTTFHALRFNVILDSSVGDVIGNSVRVRTLPEDQDTSDNTHTISTVVSNNAIDLSVRKTADPASISEGTVTFTIHYANFGPSSANVAVISDTLPTDLEVLRTTPSASLITETQTGNTYSWEVGPIPPTGVEQTITIEALVGLEDSGKALRNNVRIRGGNLAGNNIQPDWNPGNNYGFATVQPGRLDINKESSTPLAKVGEVFTYTITVPSSTTGNFNSVNITDTLQAGLDFVRATSGTPNAPSGSVTFNPTTRVVTLSRPTFNAGVDAIVLRIGVKPSTTITFADVITNTATVSWASGGVRFYRPSNVVSTNVEPAGTLVVTKTDGLTNVNPGQNISYTITISNTGNRPIRDIFVADDLIANVSAIGIETNNLGTGSCPTAQRCTLDVTSPLAANQKVTFRIAARVLSALGTGEQVINRITGTAHYDDTAGQEADTASTYLDIDTVVNDAADYDILATKGVTPQQAQVDESFTFRINVTNQGTTTIPAVRVTDQFDSVLDLTNVTTNRGTATLNTTAKTIDVNVGNLQPGQTARIEVVAKVNATATDIASYENRARISFTGGQMRTNDVRFRVLPSATLPGTGWMAAGGGLDGVEIPSDIGIPFNAEIPDGAERLAGVDSRVYAGKPAGAFAPTRPPAQPAPEGAAGAALIGLALLGGALGVLLLVVGFVVRLRRPLHAGGYARLGLGLLLAGLVTFIVGWALLPAGPQVSEQLSLLRGVKPPLATEAALTQAAAPIMPPLSATQEAALSAVEMPTNTPDASIASFLPTPTPSTLPDYPIPSPTPGAAQGPGGIEPDASPATRLVIPRLGLDTVVKYVPYNGKTWLIGGLRSEIAWMGDTSWPGLGGNTGLAGHVDLSDGSSGPFVNLKDLKAGDVVQIYTERYLYNYTVREQKVVPDHDLSVVAATEYAQITLITCTGWDPVYNVYLQRLVVFANLASVQSLTAGVGR